VRAVRRSWTALIALAATLAFPAVASAHPRPIIRSVSPQNAMPGASVTITGADFNAEARAVTPVKVYLGHGGSLLGAADVAADGSWTVTAQVPAETVHGTYVIYAEAFDAAGQAITTDAGGGPGAGNGALAVGPAPAPSADGGGGPSAPLQQQAAPPVPSAQPAVPSAQPAVPSAQPAVPSAQPAPAATPAPAPTVVAPAPPTAAPVAPPVAHVPAPAVVKRPVAPKHAQPASPPLRSTPVAGTRRGAQAHAPAQRRTRSRIITKSVPKSTGARTPSTPAVVVRTARRDAAHPRASSPRTPPRTGPLGASPRQRTQLISPSLRRSAPTPAVDATASVDRGVPDDLLTAYTIVLVALVLTALGSAAAAAAAIRRRRPSSRGSDVIELELQQMIADELAPVRRAAVGEDQSASELPPSAEPDELALSG